MAEEKRYQLGDRANGYVLTEHGWQPDAPGAPAPPTQPVPAPPQYRPGDVVGPYVLTEQGWQPLRTGGPGAGPTAPVPSSGGATPPAYPGYTPMEPAYQPAPGTGSRRGLWIGLAAALVVVLAVAVGGGLAIAGARRGASTAAPSVTSAAPAPTSASPSAPATSDPSTPSGSASSTPGDTATSEPAPSTPQSEGRPFTWSETASLSYGGVAAAQLTVAKPVAFAPVAATDKATRGQLVYVPVLVRVTGKEPVKVDPYDFEVILPNGDHLDVTYVSQLPKEAPGVLLAGEVQPGGTVVGSIPFDVPPDTPLKVAYAPDADILGTWK